MRPYVTYTTCATSSEWKTGNIITFVQFEEVNLLSETQDCAVSGDKSDDDSIMPPLLSEEEMDAMDSVNESEDETMSTEMLEDICDGRQYHLSVNRRESRYKITNRIKQRQSEWKGALKSTQNMGKSLNKVFETVVKDILQDLPPLGESSSYVYYFIPYPRNFAEVTILSDNIKKPWIKATQNDIKNLINNHNFLFQDPDKGDPVTPCMN